MYNLDKLEYLVTMALDDLLLSREILYDIILFKTVVMQLLCLSLFYMVWYTLLWAGNSILKGIEKLIFYIIKGGMNGKETSIFYRITNYFLHYVNLLYRGNFSIWKYYIF